VSKRRLVAIVAAILLASANAVVAEGVYVGVGGGELQIEDEELFDDPVSDFTFGYRIYAGFEPNRTFAFEAAFLRSDFTSKDGLPNDTQVRFSGVAAYGTASVPAGDRGRLMAKAGLLMGNREVRSVNRSSNDSTSGIALGVSYAYNLTDHFAIRGDFDTLLLSDVDTLSSLTIGVQLRFGD
jgi:hypothetical protein